MIKIKIPRFDDGTFIDSYNDVLSVDNEGHPYTQSRKYSSIQLDPIVVTPYGNMTEDYYNMLRNARLDSDINIENRLRQQSSFQPLYMPDGSVKFVPGEAGLQQISPEFDLISMAPLAKAVRRGLSNTIRSYMYSPQASFKDIPLGIKMPKFIMKPVDKIRTKFTDPPYEIIDGEKVYSSIPERRGHFYRRGAEGMIHDAEETGTINTLNEMDRLSSDELKSFKKFYGNDDKLFKDVVKANNEGGSVAVDDLLNDRIGMSYRDAIINGKSNGEKKVFIFTKRGNHTFGGRNINFQKGSIWGNYEPVSDAVIEYNPYQGDGSSFMQYGHNRLMHKDGFGNIITDQRIPDGGYGLLRGNVSIDQPNLSYWIHNGKGWVNRQFKSK